MGDMLVVTVTPDRFVDKGAHRPAFGEDLRAEALASLECVDFVAVNRWPTAVEAIHLIRPDYYVKGAVTDKGPRDHTDAIVREEDAVKSVGGQIHFTQEDTYCASALINRYLDVFSPEVKLFLADFRQKFSEADIIGYLKRIKDLRVLTIGEAIIDEYVFCDVMNKANKDPILAAKLRFQERYAGGVLAIANHVAGFCDHVTVLTFLGSHDAQERFVRSSLNRKITPRFFTKGDSPTIVKRRYLEEHLSLKLIEIDEMNDEVLEPSDEEAFCALLDELLPQFDVVIVADYGHGMFSERSINLICEKARFLALNAQTNPGNLGFNVVSKYPRADLVTIDEIEARLEMKRRNVEIGEIAEVLAQKMNCQRFLITRGIKGTLCYERGEGFSSTPVFSVKVLDRIGGGDAFLAITAPCAALGMRAEALGFIGNLAGATACAVMGNKSAIEPASFYRHISSLMK